MRLMLCVHMVAVVEMKKIRTYSELIQINSFVERFNYLKLDGTVGRDTFGYDRYLNQILYKLPEWKRARDEVIFRDNACDLGIDGREILRGILVHHMNPITVEDIKRRNPDIFNPEFLITTMLRTHNGIHYGSVESINTGLVERRKNDTIPWR